VPLHLLILNAGVIARPELQHTVDGLELQVASNHVGRFYLAQLLLPVLQRSAPSRIICVSSLANTTATLQVTPAALSAEQLDEKLFRVPSPRDYTPLGAYANSKLLNIFHAQWLNQQYAADGVTAYSLHPGLEHGHRSSLLPAALPERHRPPADGQVE
jgi:retinol dehydrogenase-12